MKKGKRSGATTTLIIINGIIILIFLLVSVILVYVTTTSTSEPGEEAQTYLLEEDGQAPTLLFLEQRQNYSVGDTVLVRSTVNGQVSYLRETVLGNKDGFVTVESDGIQFQEPLSNLVGRVAFESALLGKTLAYISDPSHTVTVVIIAAGVFIVAVCLIILTAVLFSRKKKTRSKETEEETILEQLFQIQEEDDFVKDVYLQEISEPVEVASAGDDTDPLSDEELERFRKTILTGTEEK